MLGGLDRDAARAAAKGAFRLELVLIVAGCLLLLLGAVHYFWHSKESPAPVVPAAPVPLGSPVSRPTATPQLPTPTSMPATPTLVVEPAEPAAPPAKSKTTERVAQLWVRAEEAYRAEQYEKAAPAYREIVRLDPTRTDAAERLSDIQKLQDERKAKQKTADDVARTLDTAKQLFEQQRYSDALAALERVLKLDPEQSEAKGLRDSWQSEKTRREAAAAEASKRAGQVLERGKKALDGKRYEDALAAASEVLATQPEDKIALALKKEAEAQLLDLRKKVQAALSAAEAGDVEKAQRMIDEVLKAAPEFPPAVAANTKLATYAQKAKDTTPPTLTSVTVGQAQEGKDLTVAAVAADDYKLSRVVLLYRMDTETSFTSLPMKKSGEDKYQARIPGDAIRKGDLQVRVEAYDEAGNRAAYPENGDYQTVEVRRKTRTRVVTGM
jgi:tetratricopeptide (TPR) repeat protein